MVGRSIVGVAAVAALVVAACAADPAAGRRRPAGSPTSTGRASTATSPVSDPPPTTEPGTGPSVRRLLLVGDSLMDEVAPAVRAAVGDRVDVRYVLTIGAVGVPPDWDEEWPRVVAEHRPDAVAVLVGAWEGRDLPGVPFGSPEWLDWYRHRLDEWAAALAAGGARVWWFGTLPVRDREAEPRFSLLDREYRALAERAGHVAFVDTRAVLGPAYREVDGAERLRRTDGLHLCPAGTVLLVGALLDAMDLPPAPGWEAGPWRSGPPAYDPDECPAVGPRS